MLLVKIKPRLCAKQARVVTLSRRWQRVAASTMKEVIETPNYPPVKDISFISRYRRMQTDWNEAVKNVKTVEEKLIKVNMPFYYGFKCMMVHEGVIFYNHLPQAQYITRTHFVEEPKLPAYYDNLITDEEMNKLVADIREALVDGVAFEMDSRMRQQEYSKNYLETEGNLEDLIGDAVSKQVNRIMMNNLAINYPHLLTVQVDHDPRIEAYWLAGGIELSPQRINRIKSAYRNHQELLDEPTNRVFQYIGSPSLNLRHQLPLKEIMPIAECENPNLEIPVCKYDPRTFGNYAKRRHITAIPGFWPGDQSEFGLLSYHKRGYLFRRYKSLDDENDALKVQALFANWGWLLSQAHHLGFSTYNDLTYPMVNQLIITNGQMWSFSAYQLNTMKLWGKYNDENPMRNMCWISEPMKLYEKIEDNKLLGINDDVIKNLIKFYINTPEERIGVNLRPYLDASESRIADIQEEERRIWLEDRYKRLVSNRPRHKLLPELYHWEWIYKFMFKTRPLDKKRTHWDFGLNPYLRRLDEHPGAYVPKILRPNKIIRKNRDKLAKTYYPK